MTPTGTATTYQNPLRDIKGLVPERIDQGVDYSGAGPIYPVGNAIIENVVGAGWPGGTFIEYKLTSGPQAGQHIYVAEDIHPLVSVGQTVTAFDPLGTVYHGSSGIETGWADPNVAAQRAAAHAQFTGSNATSLGTGFSQFLQSLGAPGGTGGGGPGTDPAVSATTTSITSDIGNALFPGLGSGLDFLAHPIYFAEIVGGFLLMVLGIIIVLVDTGTLSKMPTPIPVPV